MFLDQSAFGPLWLGWLATSSVCRMDEYEASVIIDSRNGVSLVANVGVDEE